MANGERRRGKYYMFRGDAIEIFGVKGAKYGPQWFLSDFGGDSVLPINPDEATTDIFSCVLKAVEAGEQVNKLLVDARTAVLLYLQGELTRDQICQAQEANGTIRISDFKHRVGLTGDDTISVTLVISQDPSYTVSTFP